MNDVPVETGYADRLGGRLFLAGGFLGRGAIRFCGGSFDRLGRLLRDRFDAVEVRGGVSRRRLGRGIGQASLAAALGLEEFRSQLPTLFESVRIG